MTAAFCSSPRSVSPYGTWSRQRWQKPKRQRHGQSSEQSPAAKRHAAEINARRARRRAARDQLPDPNAGPRPITPRSQKRLRRQTVDVQDPRSGRLPPNQQLRQAHTRTRKRRPWRVSFSPPILRPRLGHSSKSRLSPRFCQQQRQRPRH